MTNSRFGTGRRVRAFLASSEPEDMRALVTLFWRSLIALFALVYALSLAWGTLELQRVTSVLDEASSAASAAKPPLDKAAFESVVRAFALRQVSYDTLKARPFSVADPSK